MTTYISEQYLSRLNQLKSNPFAYGNLTVRSLLDLREHCLLEFDFHDPYLSQKQLENDQAILLLPKRLSDLKQMEPRERQRQLALGMLAGNVFDWGAKEVALIMESKGLDFNEALVSKFGELPKQALSTNTFSGFDPTSALADGRP